ncbi:MULTISPECIES: DUF1996 domain-containing protein [unclassified Caballeronia]|uniref:DUF1996 domain-containing protein n=2 Tax=Caballeronia TaxID=1827195 RepID=UPI00285DCE64|nr:MULTISPECIES: DUF1996 domain-containing protein [unclassified Caballeronia]MDR5775272.1 DUF1996 domain-containing protein [Caballeronia sp. LZ002]MDR5850710.1 DUF1996 domain-containing protein [Caballeronia sp. LZ003]
MKKATSLLRLLLLILLAATTTGVYAGQFSVQCAYSHTKPDDSIVRYGLPGLAMQHDFFGNRSTDAFSDLAKLNVNKATTCNITADASAYWVPQLKRAAGIVVPDFQKTYYQKNTELPVVTAIPQGLEMLAGDHHGTAANPAIAYFCQNVGYMANPPTSCPVVNGNAQFDIVIYFPDCWDGEHIKPDFSSGVQNMAYHNNKDGSCPEAYPIKIQQLQLNLQYTLGNNGDLNGAQLSMDPIMVNGVLTPQWGSLYTAHADFINAWKPDSLQYATDNCSNNGNTACSSDIPTYYVKSSSDTWLDSGGTPHNADEKLRVGPGDIIFMKFPTPVITDYTYQTAFIQTQGGDVTDSTAVYLYLFAAATNWDDQNKPPTGSACTPQSVGAIYLDNVNKLRINSIDAYVKQQIAAKAPEIAICIKNNTSKVVELNSREVKKGVPALFLK